MGQQILVFPEHPLHPKSHWQNPPAVLKQPLHRLWPILSPHTHQSKFWIHFSHSDTKMPFSDTLIRRKSTLFGICFRNTLFHKRSAASVSSQVKMSSMGVGGDLAHLGDRKSMPFHNIGATCNASSFVVEHLWNSAMPVQRCIHKSFKIKIRLFETQLLKLGKQWQIWNCVSEKSEKKKMFKQCCSCKVGKQKIMLAEFSFSQ